MIAELLGDLLGLTISDGQISRLQRIGRESLQPAYEEIAADVRNSAAVNIDETGWREDGRRAWLWTAVGRFATRFVVRRSRSRAVMRELLGDDFAGIVIADRRSLLGLRRGAGRRPPVLLGAPAACPVSLNRGRR